MRKPAVPRAAARRIIVSDEENPPELASLLAAAAPGKPGRGPAEPAEPPTEPVPDPEPPDEDPPEPDEDPDEPDEDENGEPPSTPEDGEPEKHRSGSLRSTESAIAHLPVHEGEIVHDPVRYTSRITILDAWQYPGAVRDAPGWVDRNWVGWGDYDPLRGIEPGPCLRVPLPWDPTGAQVALVRVGDYVARQEVAIADGVVDIRIEAWNRDHFEKMFIPAVSKPFRPFNPPEISA